MAIVAILLKNSSIIFTNVEYDEKGNLGGWVLGVTKFGR